MTNQEKDKRLAKGNGAAELKIIGKNFDTLNREDAFLDVTAMVRSFQRVGGEDPCFRTGKIECNRMECEWRTFCLEF